ncbi:MAG: hypothetical protein H7123_04300, partial [Thermoleophilia bacterium]|nr:hypothetical protein [Thermoleophilia bacterium]
MTYSPDSSVPTRPTIAAEHATIAALLTTDQSGRNGDDAAVIDVEKTSSICV